MGAREIGKKWLGRQMVPDYLGREGEESRASRAALAAAVQTLSPVILHRPKHLLLRVAQRAQARSGSFGYRRH
jgi:hypothetical protein